MPRVSWHAFGHSHLNLEGFRKEIQILSFLEFIIFIIKLCFGLSSHPRAAMELKLCQKSSPKHPGMRLVTSKSVWKASKEKNKFYQFFIVCHFYSKMLYWAEFAS